MNDFSTEFFRDVARGVSTRRLGQQAVPQARWQTPDAIVASRELAYDATNPGSKIMVGSMGSRLIGIADNRHILTVAGSRSGKSVTLIGNLLHYRGSVLALDPKGELASVTAARRAALGQKVHILDPFGIAPEHLAGFRKGFNPLSILTLDSDTIIEDAGLIADALVITGGKDPHWDESAMNFIEGIILHVATDPTYEGQRTLIAVQAIIRDALIPANSEDPDSAFRHELAMLRNAARLERKEATADIANAIEGAARDFYEKPANERASVLSSVRRHTKFLNYPGMRRVLSRHDFDLRDLKRVSEGLTVYLCLPANRMGRCSRWLRVFINLLLEAMEREETEPAVPVLVCLDEFPVLGHMRQLEDAAGQIASFGVKLWVFLQDWGQGVALYKERWETFAGNAGILQFFGNNDLKTMEYVSKRLGKTAVAVTREGEVSAEQRSAGLSGKTESVELYDLLTPDEVSRQFSRDDRLKRQLVIWAGYHPMILQRVEYFDQSSPVSRHFDGLYGDPAVTPAAARDAAAFPSAEGNAR
ncbi:type IV secretory system conjugative DNA transfer family protein [Sinorhizobium medicae]|uniref:type IV secretory system conjugative DNA transfer family protein n=1 Tax=Sinorhizobium medicae TaxID=110321 RepID=UPI002B1BE264|nr:type IV secretory system conjugative DNA transfer family protein [Sinorhizobium medicae]WQO45897.1 type IV secretory system conjugative DNA transfer family protein [Sinorhizobium medicae]